MSVTLEHLYCSGVVAEILPIDCSTTTHTRSYTAVISEFGVKKGSVLFSVNEYVRKLLACGNRTHATDVMDRDYIEKSWDFPFI